MSLPQENTFFKISRNRSKENILNFLNQENVDLPQLSNDVIIRALYFFQSESKDKLNLMVVSSRRARPSVVFLGFNVFTVFVFSYFDICVFRFCGRLLGRQKDTGICSAFT